MVKSFAKTSQSGFFYYTIISNNSSFSKSLKHLLQNYSVKTLSMCFRNVTLKIYLSPGSKVNPSGLCKFS